jgi:hypothetical protein
MSVIIRLLLWLAAWLGGNLAMLVAFVQILAGTSRGMRVVIAQDQAANAAFGGSEDETISSRAAKAARRGERWGCVLCKWLDRLDRGHCERVIEVNRGNPSP